MADQQQPEHPDPGSSPYHPVALAYAVAALQNHGGDRYRVETEQAGRETHPYTPRLTEEAKMSHDSSQEEDEKPPARYRADSFDHSSHQGSVSEQDMHSEEDAVKRLARNRERNREHARRTRLRKKAQLEALQSKVKDLEAERQVLKQKIEECSIASILLGLSGEQDQSTQSLLDSSASKAGMSSPRASKIALLATGKRKRFVSETTGEKQQPQPLKITVDGKTTLIGGGKSHINWKTGVYVDEDGEQRQLTHEQLETLR